MQLLRLIVTNLNLLGQIGVVDMIVPHYLRLLAFPLVIDVDLIEVLQPTQILHEQHLLIQHNTAHLRQHYQVNQLLLYRGGMILQIGVRLRLVSDMPQVIQNIPNRMLVLIRHQIAPIILPNQLEIIPVLLQILHYICHQQSRYIRLQINPFLYVHPNPSRKMLMFLQTLDRLRWHRFACIRLDSFDIRVSLFGIAVFTPRVDCT